MNLRKLTPKQLRKVIKDLRFIDLFSKISRKQNFRVVISGGYVVDGALGKITRPHNDIDIQIYGAFKHPVDIIYKLIKLVSKQEDFFKDLIVKVKGIYEYYHNYVVEKKDFRADMYYLQISTDPFSSEKVIIKNDSTEGTIQRYETNVYTLEGVSFEAQKSFGRNSR